MWHSDDHEVPNGGNEDQAVNGVTQERGEATTGMPGVAAKLRELQEQYAYLSADFDTYRRRVSQERVHAVTQAQAKILRDVVQLYDDLARAEAVLSADAPGERRVADARTGLVLVLKNCAKILERNGVVRIEQAQRFDPTYHEALLQVPATEAHPAGAIVAVLEPGYLHNGTVLRPARVSVAHE